MFLCGWFISELWYCSCTNSQTPLTYICSLNISLNNKKTFFFPNGGFSFFHLTFGPIVKPWALRKILAISEVKHLKTWWCINMLHLDTHIIIRQCLTIWTAEASSTEDVFVGFLCKANKRGIWLGVTDGVIANTNYCRSVEHERVNVYLKCVMAFCPFAVSPVLLYLSVKMNMLFELLQRRKKRENNPVWSRTGTNSFWSKWAFCRPPHIYFAIIVISTWTSRQTLPGSSYYN